MAALLLAGCARQGAFGSADVSANAVTSTRSLIGATPSALEASLGRPWLRRNDGGAEVWLYRSGTCRLDVFLYRARGAAAGGDPRVSSATPMPHGIPARSCLASLERRTTS